MTAAVLLAAGGARRMGGPNKLLLPVGGVPLVVRAIRPLLEAGLSPVIVVLGRDADRMAETLEALPVQTVRNPHWEQGMGTSLARGVAALGREAEMVAVSLGDLFSLRTATVIDLVTAFEATSRGIVIPVFQGHRGHPVLFDVVRYRDRLLALSGDEGARAVVAGASEDVLEVAVEDPGVCRDLDTPAEYARATGER